MNNCLVSFLVLSALSPVCGQIQPISAGGQMAELPGKECRLLDLSWNTPKIQDMSANLDAYGKTPFDGAVTDFAAPGDSRGLGWMLFTNGPVQVDRKQLLADARSFKKLHKGKLKYNFIRINMVPGNIDWTQDLSPLYENLEFLAKLAKEAGMVGICFDPELYGKTNHTFDFGRQPESIKKLGFEAVSRKVYEAGRECIRAFNRHMPKMEMLILFLPDIVKAQNASAEQLDWYSLLPAFVNGMLDGSTSDTIFIDGCEHAYGFTKPEEFMSYRRATLEDYPARYSNNPDLFKKKMRMGFGVWPDADTGPNGLETEGEEYNMRDPQQIARSVALAFEHGDGYVWLYTQTANLLTGRGWPKDYDRELKMMLKNPSGYWGTVSETQEKAVWRADIADLTNGDLDLLNGIKSHTGAKYHGGRSIVPANHGGRGNMVFEFDLPRHEKSKPWVLDITWSAYGTHELKPNSTGFSLTLQDRDKKQSPVNAVRYAHLPKEWRTYKTSVPLPQELYGRVNLDISLFTGGTHYYVNLYDLKIVSVEITNGDDMGVKCSARD